MPENEDGLRALSIRLGAQEQALALVRRLAGKFAAAGCRLPPLSVGESPIGNGRTAPFMGLELDLGQGLSARIALRSVVLDERPRRPAEIVRTEAGLWLLERCGSVTGRSVIAAYRRCGSLDAHWTFKVRVAPGRSKRLLAFCRGIELDHVRLSQGEIEADQAEEFVDKVIGLAAAKKAGR